MAPRFNTQTFLSEMRAEQREDATALREATAELAKKVDEGFKATAAVSAAHELADTKEFNSIDKRLETVENTRRSMLWLGATMIVAIIGVVLDMAANYLPRILASLKP